MLGDMGGAASAESPKYVSSVDRSQWVRSGDVLDIRVATTHVEESIALPFYQAYMAQCAAKRDVSEFAPNEAFQQAVESLEENPHGRCSEIFAVSQRYLHDMLDFCVSGIDDSLTLNSMVKPVEEIPGCGTAFVRNGFFIFFWETHVGEKCGRLELRNSSRIMDLQMSEVHVPLTYHIVYKGRGVTILGLVPISERTRLSESTSPEAALLSRQILSAFNLLPFEEQREQRYLPTNIEAHLGRDARIYFTKNFNWMPPWLSSRGKRNCDEQRFCTIRLQLIIRQPRGLCCRSFQKDALASDNIDAFHLMRNLLDAQIHEVPKIIGTVSDTGPDCILQRFRHCGYNYSMLGVLLMALYRNVSPPEQGVRSVLTEMFARGIKQYVHIRVCQQTHRRQAQADGGDAPQEPFANDLAPRSKDFMLGGQVADDPRGGGFGEAIHVDTTIPSSFIDIVLAVLKSLMKFQGAPRPQKASLLDPGVPPPTDLFGGDVIPHIYRKFRLLPTDCNLYRPIDDDQKAAIFQRVCQLLGVRIEDNEVKAVFPIVVHPNAPSAVAPWWVMHRTDRLGQELLSNLANRAQWQAHGAGLIPLLRLQEKFRPQYLRVLHTWESLQPPQLLLWHIMQNMLSREALDRVITERKQALNVMNVSQTRTLVQLLRKQALCAYERHGADFAIPIAAEVLKYGEMILEHCRNDFSTQLRLLTSEYAHYLGSHRTQSDGDISVEVTMVRTMSRFCVPDILIALDFLQLGVLRHRFQLDGAERDFQRCLTILDSLVGAKHPHSLRALANLAALWYGGDRRDTAVEIFRQISQLPHCPRDVLGTLLEVGGDESEDADELRRNFEAATKAKPEPHSFVVHQPKY